MVGYCAQRLSASSEDSLTVGTPDRFTLDVLNAFRHHRKTHWRQEIADKAHIPVLNAFRHHRKTHDAHITGSSIECSTPFGIIGRLTWVSVVVFTAVQCAQRLSASSEDSP